MERERSLSEPRTGWEMGTGKEKWVLRVKGMGMEWWNILRKGDLGRWKVSGRKGGLETDEINQEKGKWKCVKVMDKEK